MVVSLPDNIYIYFTVIVLSPDLFRRKNISPARQSGPEEEGGERTSYIDLHYHNAPRANALHWHHDPGPYYQVFQGQRPGFFREEHVLEERDLFRKHLTG
jgi:hypothetical protein